METLIVAMELVPGGRVLGASVHCREVCQVLTRPTSIPDLPRRSGLLAQGGRGCVMDDTDDGTPGSWGPRADALAEELERELPPPLWTRVVELVTAVEDHTT